MSTMTVEFSIFGVIFL